MEAELTNDVDPEEVRTGQPAESTFNEETVWSLFGGNWVFRLFKGHKDRYVRFSLLITFLFLAAGAVLSLLAGALRLYITNVTPYLNALALFLIFVAFGWYSNRLTEMLITLSDAFAVPQSEYTAVVKTWADRIANKNWLLALFGLPLAIANLMETVAYWNSRTPPPMLEPWITSASSQFFEVLYGFVHVIVAPFLLGSGIGGLVGTILLLHALLKLPLKLANYQRLSSINGLTATLVMLTLIALAGVSLFGRPIAFFRADIELSNINAILQSLIFILLALAVGAIPLLRVNNAINKAKRLAVENWQNLHNQISLLIVTYFQARYAGAALPQDIYGQEASPDDLPPRDQVDIEALLMEQRAIEAQLNYIKNLSTFPVDWGSIFKVGIGVVLSLFSGLVQEYWVSQVAPQLFE